MVELFSLLVRSCYNNFENKDQQPEEYNRPPTQLEGPIFTLAPVDQEFLLSKVLIYDSYSV